MLPSSVDLPQAFPQGFLLYLISLYGRWISHLPIWWISHLPIHLAGKPKGLFLALNVQGVYQLQYALYQDQSTAQFRE